MAPRQTLLSRAGAAFALVVAAGAAVRIRRLREATEEAIARARSDEGRLREPAEAAPVGMLQTDSAGRLVDITERGAAMLGVTRAAAAGGGWLSALDPAGRQAVRGAIRVARDDGEARAAVTGPAAGGRPGRDLVVRLSAVRGPAGEAGALVGTVTDVTREHRAVVEAERQRTRAAALMAAFPDGVMVLGEGGVVVEVNERLCAMAGRPRARLLGATAPFSWCVPEAGGCPFAGAARLDRVVEEDVTLVRTDGAVVPAIATASPLRGPAGAGLLVTFKDISDRKRAEAGEQALRRVAEAVAGGAPEERLFGLVAEEAGRLLRADAGAVIRFAGPGTGRVVGRWAEDRVPAMDVVGLDGDGAVSRVAATGRPARVADYAGATGALARELRDLSYRSGAAAPVRVGGALWGAVAVAHRRAGAVSPAAERRLASFAELVAMGLSNAESRAALAELATTDHLTGLPNRRAFEERLAAEVERARRADGPLALVILDLDRFKRVNDDLGHPAGDRVLVEVARRLAGVARAGETVARLGGEEFGWLLPGAGAAGGRAAAERARRAVGGEPVPGVGRAITLSAGVCDLAAAGDAAALVAGADAALYRAKRAGRDRVAVGRAVPAPARVA